MQEWVGRKEGKSKNMNSQTMKVVAGLSELNNEMLSASGETGIKAMMELCQRVLDGREIPVDWNMSVRERGYAAYRGVKLLEHAKKIVERVMERRV